MRPLDIGSRVHSARNYEQTKRNVSVRFRAWSAVESIGVQQQHSYTEVIYEHHTPHHPDSIPCWRVAYLVLQRELGLRSQRRVKLGPLSLGRSVADWSDLTGCRKTWLARENLDAFACLAQEENIPAG